MGALFDRPSVLILLILVLVVLFGAKRLPDAARGLGRSLRIFKAETEGLRGDGDSAVQQSQPTAAQQPAVPPAPVPPAVAAPVQPVQPPQPVQHGPRYLVDPVTGEQVLAQPVTPPSDGAPRA